MYERDVRATVVVVLGLNVALAVAKIIVGVRADALSVVGDGLHSLVDGAANVLALVFVTAASRPADEDHPFGHGRYETLGALALALVLFLTAIELGREAVAHLATGAPA
ncbi:MAG: cation diffusion facilitator family transporter, partial [Thermoplasmatota archaeon]